MTTATYSSHAHEHERSAHGIGYWLTMALAVVLLAFGLAIFAGGVWLISLGGSYYYAIAGVGLLLTAYFLFRASMAAFSVYLVTWLGTLAWAFWEVGFDWWAQLPRLLAPTIVLLLVAATIPVLKRAEND
ncbi:hypothetical protein [Breoghania sp. JC706]|uniref:hypothetical protein n=1 Tax=Breoghania sp. JC706 TaxID=3117732 RepID=UPI003007F899